MDASKAAGYPTSGGERDGGSFAEMPGKKGPTEAGPQVAFASLGSLQAVDLAAGLGPTSPGSVLESGGGMHRYEEEMNSR